MSKVADIPCDFAGVMGVPITFLDKYNPEQFEILELKSPHTLEFESYLMDVLIAWMKGEPVDFGEVEKAVYTFGDFTEMEKLLFESGRIQERLWAIYLYLIDPNMNL